jgi:hypothetical protein
MVRRTFLAVACAASLLACGNDGPAGPVNQNGDFAVTVSSGRNPTYSWPAGQGFSVSVMRTSARTTIVWGLANPARTLTGPVTHGTVPQGSLESAATEKTLTSGVQYRVSITLADGKTGWREFTP